MALLVQCPKCEGCGYVADTEEHEPWTAWMKLPIRSAAAVIVGLVKPIECPKCLARGVVVQADIGGTIPVTYRRRLAKPPNR